MWISLWGYNYDAIIFYIRCIILSIPVLSCLFLSVPVCSCLFLSVPVCSLFLNFLSDIWNSMSHFYHPVCSCLFLSVPVWSCQFHPFLSVTRYMIIFWLLKFLHEIWIYVCSYISYMRYEFLNDAIIFYIRYLILYIPVCSCLFPSVSLCLNFTYKILISLPLNFIS